MSFEPRFSHSPSPPHDQGPGVLHTAAVQRYLSVAGLVAVLYDHVLAFDDETRVIWTAPRSFAKWMFLLNRYLSEVCLLVVANEMSGFSHHRFYDDKRCQIWTSTMFVYGIFSTLTANLLVFLRVVVLWDKSPRVVLGLSIMLALCTVSSIAAVTASIIILGPTIRYNALAQACVVTRTSPSIVATFASPTIFELSALFLITYNALSRPRDSTTRLMRVLYRDGILFFLALTLFRATNLITVTFYDPAVGAVPIFFSWAMITLVTNRLLISLRSSDRGGRLSECEDSLGEDDMSSPELRASAESANPDIVCGCSDIELRDCYAR